MKKFLSLVLALVMTMSLVTISAGATEYKDLTDKDEIQYEEAVAVLNRIGIITGYEDGTFRPETELTRGAAAKIIVSLMIGPDAANALPNNASPYPDVPAGHTFAGVIGFCSATKYDNDNRPVYGYEAIMMSSDGKAADEKAIVYSYKNLRIGEFARYTKVTAPEGVTGVDDNFYDLRGYGIDSNDFRHAYLIVITGTGNAPSASGAVNSSVDGVFTPLASAQVGSTYTVTLNDGYSYDASANVNVSDVTVTGAFKVEVPAGAKITVGGNDLTGTYYIAKGANITAAAATDSTNDGVYEDTGAGFGSAAAAVTSLGKDIKYAVGTKVTIENDKPNVQLFVNGLLAAQDASSATKVICVAPETEVTAQTTSALTANTGVRIHAQTGSGAGTTVISTAQGDQACTFTVGDVAIDVIDNT